MNFKKFQQFNRRDPKLSKQVSSIFFLLITTKEIIYIMGIFFWDFRDFNDIQRQWSMFIVNIFAFIFTFYSLIRTAKYHGKILFQLLPLSINTIATLILLFIKLFEKGYSFDLVGYAIQIFTYFLFCYTFTVMHSKLIEKQRYLQISKLCNILFVIFAVGVIALIVLIMTSVIAKNCENDIKSGSIVCFCTEFVSYIPTMYFGVDIIRNITKKHQQQKAQSSNQLFLFAQVSDQYIKQRKKQIKIVLGGYTSTLVLRAAVLILNLCLPNYFNCINYQGVNIITSEQAIGQIILVVVQINELIPHLIIPIALFIIPVKQSTKSNYLTFEETLIIDDQTHHVETIIQRKVSNSILTRSYLPKKKQSSDTDSSKSNNH